ncbi:MAG: tRNA uridine-5-carboxymethylaminomethyl(34) synthesis GTPase MnmE [Legionellales bacterium RIFCSPHIGHO2_12_FULL_37_14]|nr:MAG: tRNA uridine-5-carboxymethylaminomethyl(34) synthesis GTPase MnmE [Legionellales bacterium RIFCSPHIGHO2_12_FULL_37_14]
MSSLGNTIVAIATAPYQGAIGIIRLSGPLAYQISQKLLRSKNILKPRQAKYCKLKDKNGVLVDEAIVIFYPAPNSFTGEDVVELQCHGSIVVLDAIVKICLDYGALYASQGEFSLRAFLNGKIDLVQAEAIADLIAASSIEAANMAQRSLAGDFSKLIENLQQKLTHLRVLVEAGVDFPDEDIDLLKEADVKTKLQAISNEIKNILNKAQQGSLMQEGCKLIIVGAPNAGKSTLMNLLAGKEVAIVTPIPGTTRDLMQEKILIDGLPFLLVDTAGLRTTECPIEQEGMKRAKEAIKQADLLLWVTDCTSSEALHLDTLLDKNLTANIKVLTVVNKIDILPKEAGNLPQDAIYISAKTGEGVENLRKEMLKAVGYKKNESLFIARRRHLEALEATKKAINLAQEQINTTHIIELIAEELRQAQLNLSAITGEFSSDQLLGEIFSTFCIGK